MSVALLAEQSAGLNSREWQHRINALRVTDNWTNWFYIAREYAFLAVVIGPALMVFHAYATGHLGLEWLAPTVVLVGAGQHRLATLGRR